jgi:hypothetical protein
MNLLVSHDLTRHDDKMGQIELSKLPGYLPPAPEARARMTLDCPPHFAPRNRPRPPFRIAISGLAGVVDFAMRDRKVNTLSTSPLPATHLTNFFQHHHGVDIASLGGDEAYPFWLEAKRRSGTLVEISYRLTRLNMSAFWELLLSRETGSIQMNCVGNDGPLTGAGDVTRLRLARALVADGRLLTAD